MYYIDMMYYIEMMYYISMMFITSYRLHQKYIVPVYQISLVPSYYMYIVPVSQKCIVCLRAGIIAARQTYRVATISRLPKNIVLV